jgi:uncharacterized protein (DUF2147 family)
MWEEAMLFRLSLAAFGLIAASGVALAEPIVGNWRTESGAIARIAPCGSQICITLTSGEHAGKQIGQMTPQGNDRYRGTITDPADDRTYSGNGTVSGNTLSMQGCVAAIFCRTQTWSRQ